MRILVVAPFLPLPLKSGGHTRLFHIVKRLSERHAVDLVCLTTPGAREYVPELARMCRSVAPVELRGASAGPGTSGATLRGLVRLSRRALLLLRGIPLEASGFYFSAMQEKVNQYLAGDDYDVIEVEFTRMAQYVNASSQRARRALRVLVDYDLSFLPRLRGYVGEERPTPKLAKYLDYQINKSYALRMWKQFDRLVVTSEVDRRRALAMSPELCVRVVPNGVDLDEFRPLPKAHTRDARLLFLGGVMHPANVDGLFYFLRQIFPRVRQLTGGVELTVIGEGWDRHRAEMAKYGPVRLTGFVPDIRPYCRRSDIMVVPLRIGGGTRLKIMEAMALGIPVVASSVGCEGIEVQGGRDLLVADKPAEFAAKVAALLGDRELQATLSANACAAMQQKYGWDRVMCAMEEVYQRDGVVVTAQRNNHG